MIKKILIALLFVPCVSTAEEEVDILISANDLKEKYPEEFFLDGEVNEHINDDSLIDRIVYAYTANTPPIACGLEENCSEINAQFLDKPTMTFEIVMNNSERISVRYFCSSIGIYKTKYSNGMVDIFCGPSYKLKWNGKEYLIAY